MKVKAWCSCLVAIILFVVPTVSNAGFIAIPIAEKPDHLAEIFSLDSGLDSHFEASGTSDVESSVTPLLADYSKPDESAYAVGLMEPDSAELPLAGSYSTDSSAPAETLAGTAMAVREPSTLALLGIGLIAIALLRRCAGT
jgi:hypothetical protein